MPRRARQVSSTGVYHVMGRGLNKLAVFNQTRERTRFLNLIRENLADYEIELYAYCIMPNHFHLLVKVELESLASFMVKVLASYAHYYNTKHNRVGYVFQDRYKSQCVEDAAYYFSCLRYIHMNPVKAKICCNTQEYRYSSMAEYCNGKADLLHKEAFVKIGIRFRDKKEFIEFHNMKDEKIFADVKEEVFRQQKDAAELILSDMQVITKLPKVEILDYFKTREKFEKTVMTHLYLSRSKAQEIRNVLRKELGTG